MLVQAQVVPWWGTGRPAEFSPSGFHPSRASPTGRRIGGYDYKTESFQRPRVEQHAHSREMKNSNFFGAPPLGVGVFGKLLVARKRKDRQRNRLGRSQHAPACPRNRKPAGDVARQLRFAVSQQILPPAGNRKPASDRGHWLQPVPCSSRRRSCPGRERGDRQSSVPADPTPSRAPPTGGRDRRVRLQNRGDSATARGQLRT